ncbi:STAS domain-containing protein [Streptomyces flavofungini]|uniref:STAS domain-containing protein n=2 Tax=Streptomyces flavofungini TaxID=68200 RepID=A0ABS0X693_9ACTN|nr:STAS domain-containing protein [Streptomyces flavofungini]
MSSDRRGGPPNVAVSQAHSPNLLVMSGPVRQDDIPRLVADLCAVAHASGAAEVICDVGGITTADLMTVEAVARLGLAARRAGTGLRLRGPTPALWALLRLVGLAELCVEVEGDPEEREPPLGVEEAVESGDAAR